MVKVEPVGEFELKGIRRPLAAYNVLSAISSWLDATTFRWLHSIARVGELFR
jgi:hypothetical protein